MNISINALSNNTVFLRRLYKRFYIGTVVSFLFRNLVYFLSVFLAGNLLGQEALATVGLLMPFYFIYIVIGGLFEVGCTVVCSDYIGKDDFDGAKKVVTAAYVSSFIMCALIALLGLLFLDSILSVLNIPAAMLSEARIYAMVYLLFGFFVSSVSIGYGLLRFDGYTEVLTVITAILPVCSYAVTTILIREFSFGLSAAAIGSCAGYVLTGLVMLYALAVKAKVLSFSKAAPEQIVGITAKIARGGAANSVGDICFWVSIMVINSLLITGYGEAALSAFTAFLSLTNLLIPISLGSAFAFIQLVGVMNAERDSNGIQQVIRTSFIYGMTAAVVAGVLLILLSPQIMLGFGLNSVDTQALMRTLLAVLAAGTVLDVFFNTLVFLFNTLGRHAAATALVIAKKIGFLLPTVFILSGAFGATGIWHALWLCSALSICAALIYGAVMCGKNHYLSKVFLIDTEAEQNGTYTTFFVINTIDGIMRCSRGISGFCQQNKLTPARSNGVALAIEEMLLLIRERSLKSAAETMNVRILLYKGEIIMRIRYCGSMFNPLAFYKGLKLKLTLSDALRNQEFIGVKMVVDTAKNTDYSQTFGINNLTITI